MISSTFIALFLFTMPIVTGLVLFCLSTVRTSAIATRSSREIVAGGALAVFLLSASSLLLAPQWAQQYVASSKQRAELKAADKAEAVADAKMIAKYEARMHSPANPYWLERWEFFSMEESFPLEVIESQSVADFLSVRISSHDAFLTRMEWHGAPRASANHCEIRQWDAVHGDWNHPLIVWFVRPPNVAAQEGRLGYSGFAMIRGGYSAQLFDHHEGDGDLEGGTRILERLFYNRYGGEFTAIPLHPQPPPLTYDVFNFLSETPISTAGTAAHREALLRATSDDKFELVRELERGTERRTISLRSGDASIIRARLDDPDDPADDAGFPVDAYFFSDDMPLQQRNVVIAIAKDRAVYRWRQENRNQPHRAYFRMRNVGVEPNPQPSSKTSNVMHSALRWKYETNFAEVPVMYGSVRCVGRPPGEMKAIMALGTKRGM